MTTLPLIAILLAGIALDEGPVLPEPVYERVDKTDPALGIAWDWAGLDTGGGPVAVDRVVYRFVHVPDDPLATPERQMVIVSGSISAGTTTHRLSGLLAAVTPGRYRLAIQFRSASGLWGGFSEDLFIEVVSGGDPEPSPRGPAPPTGLRIERQPGVP